MRKYMVFAIAGGIILSSVGNFVKAQDDATGPFKFSLDVNANFTDNRDSSIKGYEEDNTDIYVKPRIDAYFDWGSSLLDFYYIPIYRYRSNPSSFQDTNKLLHELGIDGKYEVSPIVSLRAKEFFKYSDDPTLASGGVNVRRDGMYYLNDLDGGMSYDVTRESRMDFDLLWHTKQYDESTFSYLEENSLNGDLAFRHDLTRSIVGLIQVKATKFDYGKSSDDADRDFSNLSGGLGMESQFLPESKLSIYAGYASYDFDEAKMDSQSFPYATLVLEHHVNATTIVKASSMYGLRETAVQDYSVQEYLDFRGDLSMDVSKSISLGLGGIYRYSTYDSDYITPQARDRILAAGGTIDDDANQTTVVGYGSIAYKLTEDALLKLFYSYTDDDSDVSNTFKKNDVILSFVQHF